jgi:hypothetical protein
MRVDRAIHSLFILLDGDRHQAVLCGGCALAIQKSSDERHFGAQFCVAPLVDSLSFPFSERVGQMHSLPVQPESRSL